LRVHRRAARAVDPNGADKNPWLALEGQFHALGAMRGLDLDRLVQTGPVQRPQALPQLGGIERRAFFLRQLTGQRFQPLPAYALTLQHQRTRKTAPFARKRPWPRPDTLPPAAESSLCLQAALFFSRFAQPALLARSSF
jgi:hypothetical protein